MSLFRISDYTGKKQTTYSSKTKLPTKFKTKHHKCGQCPRTDATKQTVSEKEIRWLCPDCIVKNNNRDSKETVHFVRASSLG